jgi:hypothetical protein
MTIDPPLLVLNIAPISIFELIETLIFLMLQIGYEKMFLSLKNTLIKEKSSFILLADGEQKPKLA